MNLLPPSQTKAAFSYRNTHYQLQADSSGHKCYQMPYHGTVWALISRAKYDAFSTKSAAQAQRHNRNDFSQG